MPTNDKILKEIITLQALHAEGLKRATTLRGILEGELKPSPRTLRRSEIGAQAVAKRNAYLTKKTA